MAMIQMNHLTFSYDTSADLIFDDVSFQIDTNWKLGLIGRNGRGKTTLLKILARQLDYQGQLVCPVTFDYFPLDVAHPNWLVEDVLKELCPNAETWQLLREFSYLNLKEEILWHVFDTLSKGEQTKALLCALFLKEENFLLIDEPTNHLDEEGRRLLANYLKQKKGFILVSHDRYFLDTCINHVMSINRATIDIQTGNFSSWQTNFERQENYELKQNQQLKKEISHLEHASKKTNQWARQVEASKIGAADKGYVGHKAAKMMQRSKSIEARQQKAISQKKELLKNVETVEALKLSTLKHPQHRLCIFKDVQVVYDGKPIFEPLTFEVSQGERVLLKGVNGSGKSSLIKALMDENITYKGEIKKASHLKISYVSQDTTYLKGDLKTFCINEHIDESLFKSILRKMDFERSQFEKNIEDFSEGQKKKVILAKSLCEQAHLYIWDEPLNYIDVFTRMQLENLLLSVNATMIFIEHDRSFQKAIATKVIMIQQNSNNISNG